MSHPERPTAAPAARPADDARVARAVRAWLADGIATLPDGMELPAEVRHHLIDQLTTTPQRRRWWSDRWPTRGRRVLRSDGVPGDSDERRTRRMFGFAALMAAGALGGAALLATMQQDAGPRTIVVAQDGSGDVTTIGEGVALADDGDTVLIGPGTYHEQVTVTEGITLKGDGPREAVVLEGLPGAAGPFSILLDQTAATLTGLTLNGMPSELRISGGSPLVEDVAIVGAGLPYGSPGSCEDARGCAGSLVVADGSTATIRGNTFTAGGEVRVEGDADPVFEGNTLQDGPHVYLADPGDAAILRDNTISGTYDRAIGIFAPSTMLIEGNVIEDAGGDGITVGWTDSTGIDPVIRGNTIRRVGWAINVQSRANPTIEGNTIEDATNGILLGHSAAVVEGNTIRRIKGAGVIGATLSTPVITGNSIEDSTTGITIDASVTATITGNAFCGNEVDFRSRGDVTPLPPGNTVCGDAPPSAAP